MCICLQTRQRGDPIPWEERGEEGGRAAGKVGEGDSRSSVQHVEIRGADADRDGADADAEQSRAEQGRAEEDRD